MVAVAEPTSAFSVAEQVQLARARWKLRMVHRLAELVLDEATSPETVRKAATMLLLCDLSVATKKPAFTERGLAGVVEQGGGSAVLELGQQPEDR